MSRPEPRAFARRNSPAAHWSQRFPALAEQADDALLEVLRLAAASGDASGPLGAALSVLAKGLARPLETFASGTPERSFDETWLLALFAALRQADLARYQFLLRSRLRAAAAARAHFALTQAQVWIEARL